jgi:6-phosphogluconate dehydrogenase (decarboxylating)
MPGKVEVIGLGAMGGPMALNLLKHGFSLVVHDIDPKKLEPAAAAGAAVAPSPEAVAATAERTISMVETTDLLLANLTQKVYQMARARARGLNKEDGSAIIKVFEELAGVKIGRGE